jgi:hypothetical protein
MSDKKLFSNETLSNFILFIFIFSGDKFELLGKKQRCRRGGERCNEG